MAVNGISVIDQASTVSAIKASGSSLLLQIYRIRNR
ncbi:unnamed protein product [Soboliphyme baturini]|uniref:Uncharacterized protein n=1 Tax=Soboliphyme baturini TaxID=241478 RepID=A0A3P7ZXE4_9BILA|nr:unnamed protein product [Soboliphyme baturini]